jgi:hypothetical protein
MLWLVVVGASAALAEIDLEYTSPVQEALVASVERVAQIAEYMVVPARFDTIDCMLLFTALAFVNGIRLGNSGANALSVPWFPVSLFVQ